MSKRLLLTIIAGLVSSGMAGAQSLPPAAPPSAPAVPHGQVVHPFDMSQAPSQFEPVCPGLELRPCPVPDPDECCKTYQVLASVEYLLWYVRNNPVPVPLVTTSSPASLGILGNSDTRVLFPTGDISYGGFSGNRYTVGASLAPDHFGFEASFFQLYQRSTLFSRSSDSAGNPVLARPFFDASTLSENAEIISFPGAFNGQAPTPGGITVSSSSLMFGYEFNGLLAVCGACWEDPSGTKLAVNLDSLIGYRYVDLAEDLVIRKSSDLLGNGLSALNGVPLLPPNNTTVVDAFATHNHFYGGQVGIQGEARANCFFCDAALKLAIGSTHEEVTVVGSSTATLPDGTRATVPGGILALPSNSGGYSHQSLAFVPEAHFTVGYQLGEHVRVFVGYDFLYWSQVARPGEQINRVSNSTSIPVSLTFGPLVGANEPTFRLNQSQFWVQGLDLGVAVRY